MTSSKKFCSNCEKITGTFSCDGCQQSFCLKHVGEHRQELIFQMDNIEQEHNIFHEDLLNEIQKQKQNQHIIFNQIDKWEKESIEKIQQTAKESRIILKQILDSINDYGQKSLNKISLTLRRARHVDDFFENDITQWTQQLNHLRAEIKCMSNSIDITNDNSTSGIKFIKIVHDQTIENPNIIWTSPFSWISNVKTLFYDRSQRSLSTGDNEMKNCSKQSYTKDSILTIQVNNIDIENNSWTEKDQNMTGWILRHDVDKKSKIIYKFLDDFILKCRSNVHILVGNKGDIDDKEDEILIIENSEEYWDIGSHVIT